LKTIALTSLILAVLASVVLAENKAEDKVDNPHYKLWASFKPGTTCKAQAITVIDDGKAVTTSRTVITTTLEELTPDEATIKFTGEEETANGPVSTLTITTHVRAKISPSTTRPLPGIFEKGEGDEEITVLGKKYKTHWAERGTRFGETRLTVWTSAEVPDGLVKQVTETTFKPVTRKETVELMGFTAASQPASRPSEPDHSTTRP
jgi:hypothetical protein